MGTRHDYAKQAATYDDTRAASPSVLEPLLAALTGAPGPELLDVGGGTGNYAVALREHGFRPLVVEISESMLEHARAKRLRAVRADAAALPIAAASVDAVVMISMLHHVPDWRRALGEARRVLRPGGRLVLQVFTAENVQVHWVCDIFAAMRPRMRESHPALREFLAELPGARATPFSYADVEDGSMAALCRRPELILEARRRAQTSYFEQLAEVDPDGLREGLAYIEQRLRAGWRPDREKDALRERVGDGTVIGWSKPGEPGDTK